MIGDALGNRMKDYEAGTRLTLTSGQHIIVRVDGRAFHTYLRGAKKPFDYEFISHMQHVGISLCSEISGAKMAYGQSDEISVVLDAEIQPWFGGVVQKMASVAASIATLALIQARGLEGLPQFDARVFVVPSEAEVDNYLIWRQRDAIRNSISMVAQAHFSHRELEGKNSQDMRQMLWDKHEITWSSFPVEAKNGWVVEREVRRGSVVYVDKRTSQTHTTIAMRRFWDVRSAGTFVCGGLQDEEEKAG